MSIDPKELRLVDALKEKIDEYMGKDVEELSEDIAHLSGLNIEEASVIVRAVILKLTLRGKLILKRTD